METLPHGSKTTKDGYYDSQYGGGSIRKLFMDEMDPLDKVDDMDAVRAVLVSSAIPHRSI